jgi:hypothetical protein
LQFALAGVALDLFLSHSTVQRLSAVTPCSAAAVTFSLAVFEVGHPARHQCALERGCINGTPILILAVHMNRKDSSSLAFRNIK